MGFFDFFFGKKKEPEKKPEVQPPKPQQANVQQQQRRQEEQNWIYESILQYLTSPIWKIAISEFIDANCIVFDDEEENKLEYMSLHKKFKKLMAEQVDTMMNDLFINEEQFAEQVEKGIKHPKDKTIFEQLLTIDNFLVFKAMMIKRNKELELEAMKEMDKQDQRKNQRNPVVNQQNLTNIKLLEIEAEKAELEYALKQSLAVEEERKKMLTEEDRQLQEVMKLSLVDYQKNLLNQKAELERREQELKKVRENAGNFAPPQMPPQQQQQQQQQVKVVENKNSDGTPTPLKSEYMANAVPNISENSPTMAEFYQSAIKEPQQVQQEPKLVLQLGVKQPEQKQQEEKVEQQQPQIPILQSKKLDKLSTKPNLPPVQPQPVIQQADSVIQFDMDGKEDDKEISKSALDKIKGQKIEEPKQNSMEESIEQRKKRLLEQRELLRKKKEEENRKALEDYKNEKKIVQPQQEGEQQQQDNFLELQRKNTQDELERKRKLLEEKKNQIKLQKEKQEREKLQAKEEEEDLL